MAKLVEIRWPSGIVQRLENVKAGQMLKATEPAMITRRQLIASLAARLAAPCQSRPSARESRRAV